ncbi:MAG: hypothetical protein NT062_17860 [Proteobacteria bacterium]|nr:hypothetical protein [Pseudomonadota bacterium]
MAMRSFGLRVGLIGLGVLLVPLAAHADKLGGFSGVDRPYLVNQDRVCKPLTVTEGAARGTPKCETLGADVVAKLSMKDPILQEGAKATFAAKASGRTITVARNGTTIVAWDAFDPISKVVGVYTTKYEDRVGIEYLTRRAGKDVTDVVVFDLGQGGTAIDPSKTPGTTPPTTPTTTPPVVVDPKVTKAVADARKATKGKILAAWQAVLAIDATHSEAMYRIAQQHMSAKKSADAIAMLQRLAASTAPDAIEWAIEARFDAAFAPVRADPAFRTATGLDRKATTPYERIMALGGKWEQTGTSCDKAEVRLDTLRDRSFKLRVKTACQGQSFDHTWKGSWELDGAGIKLVVPTRGQAVTDKDAMSCRFEPKGDEDQLHCFIGRDLDFVVLPTRR